MNGRSSTILFASRLGKLLDPLSYAEHVLRELQMAALFEYRDQFVEFGAGVRPGDHDADGMKQFFALRTGFGFDFVDDLLELLWRQFRLARGFIFKNLHGEAREDGIGVGQTEDFGVVRRGQSSFSVVLEDQRGPFG